MRTRVIGIILAVRNRCVWNVWNSCDKSRALLDFRDAGQALRCGLGCYLPLAASVPSFCPHAQKKKQRCAYLKRLTRQLRLRSSLSSKNSSRSQWAFCLDSQDLSTRSGFAHKFDIKHAASQHFWQCIFFYSLPSIILVFGFLTLHMFWS